jgi:hypothetical protein
MYKFLVCETPTSEHSFHFTGLPRALGQLSQEQNITHHAVFSLFLADCKHQALVALQKRLTNAQLAPVTSYICILGIFY